MFYVIIAVIYGSMQFFLFVKAMGFLRNAPAGALRKYARLFVILFFIWVIVPVVYEIFFYAPAEELPPWQLYGFAYPFYTWATASIALFILYGIKDIIAALVRAAGWCFRTVSKMFPAAAHRHAAEPDRRRRTFLRYASAGIAVPPIALAAYGVIAGTREFYVNSLELHYAGLPENLRGLKVAQLSDLHCSQYTPKEQIAVAVSIVNDALPDIVLLTGDFVPMDAHYIYPCAEALRGLTSRYGVFASQGNHEIWTDARLIRSVLEKAGIPVLYNGGMTLTIRGEKLNLLGVDDSRWGRADITRALGMTEPGHFQILMSHQPPYWDKARDYAVELTLSGHTHGGQVGIELFHADLNIGELFHKYNKGLFEKNGMRLYVNQGIGFTGPPIRLNTPPEVTLITLT